MSPRTFSFGTLSRLAAVMVGLVILAGCGGGSSSSTTTTTTGTAAVTLNPTSLTFTSGVGVTTTAQSVTITNSGTATLTFSSITTTTTAGFAVAPNSNTCGTSLAAGSACSIGVTFDPTAAGSASGSLMITDNASNSPQSVTLTGTATSVSATPTSLSFTGVAQGTTSPVQSVTLDNTGSSAVTITSITASAGFGETNNCGASLAANSTCQINVTFSPSATGSTTGTITIANSATSSPLTVNLTGSTSVSNSVSVTAGFGPNGYTGAPTATSSAYYNGVFTSVSVCQPGTSTCVTVPNVLVDTGSVGLRVLQSALTGVTLTQNNDGSGNLENECTEYGDGSFNWGPISMATVQIGGETASAVPAGSANTGIAIQLISGDTVPSNVKAAGQCVTSSSSPDEYTVQTLGANGILGIGTEPNDCSLQATNYCTTLALAEELQTYPYWFCTTAGVCEQEVLTSNTQVLWNPVNAFSSGDTAGVLLSLPSVPAVGAATETGTLTFGIGTASDNALGSAIVYELDASGNFASASFNNISVTSSNSGGTFIDSGSNALFVADPTTLGTTDCTVGGSDIGYFCPSSTLTPSLGLTGANSTTTSVTLNIANALNLFSANTSFADFYNLAGPSCIPETGAPCSLATDYFDLGLPFFYGRPIFVGIAGSNTSYPNGYWAF